MTCSVVEGSVVQIAKRLRALPGNLIAVAALLMFSSAQAASVPPGSDTWSEMLQARFDPGIRQTRVAGHVKSGLCFSFGLSQEWRLETDDAQARLIAAHSNAELEVSLRSAHELREMPQPDLASRDAALLQRDYEGLLGRPAQSVSLASSISGATRWSATWVDANLPAASHAMTVETFILPISREWVLELSLTNIETEETYNALVQELLAGFKIQNEAACQR
jgi:hypothetical protein